MTKVRFKNPEGDTHYYATLGFDWAAFFGFLFLGGLPFFLRKMNMLGFYTILLDISVSISLISQELTLTSAVFDIVFLVGIAIFFGIKGGELTARHYKESKFKIDSNDKTLMSLANQKWGFD